jgi:TRAP-type uncharacterized transport system substrate-binding protein
LTSSGIFSKPKTYPFQDTPVKTYAVKSILITYDYNKNDASYRRVEKLARCISEKLPYLRRYGHPKWKEVDPSSAEQVKWPIHSAVQKYLREKEVIKRIEQILHNM